MFQQPSQGGDKFNVADHVGALVLIYAKTYRDKIMTQAFGEKDAVEADVHVLDGPHANEVTVGALLFQGALIGALKPAIGGDPVLGRIDRGTGKPGQNPPYILTPFTQADAATATAYLTRVQQPATQPPAAAASGGGGTAAPGVDYSSLPPEVVELLRQSGQLPAGV